MPIIPALYLNTIDIMAANVLIHTAELLHEA